MFVLMMLVRYIINIDDVDKLFKLLGAILFSVGLYMVCALRFMLYTGKIGSIYVEHLTCDMVRQLGVMLIANMLGSCGFGYTCYWIFRNTKLYTVTNDIVMNRTMLKNFNDYFSSFVNSVLCGSCVYAAVRCYSNGCKWLLMVFVAWFVYCGYEHCIADAYYYSFVSAFNLHSLWSIIINVVGNTLGPALVCHIWMNNDEP